MTPRHLAEVERRVTRTATLLGEDAFYAWGSGKNHIEGASITLAAALMLAWGNAVIEAGPVQETAESWIFTHTFIDLERGVSLTRQFRQPRRETVFGRMDPYRKEMINFGKGQSRSIRNTILMAMPEWLVKKALEVALQGARVKMEQFIKDKGLAAAQAYTVNQLKRVGVPEDAVLARMGKAEVRALDLDDLVALAADCKSIDSGQEAAASLFDLPRPGTGPADLKARLKTMVEPEPASPRQGAGTAKAPPAPAKVLQDIAVRPGVKPFTWLVAEKDGEKTVMEYLVVQDEPDLYVCNCKPRSRDCDHVLAAMRFALQP
jgi:hypothetical protein